MDKLLISEAGDAALFCKLGNKIDPLISKEVLLLNNKIKRAKFENIIETVPSYIGLMIYYKPEVGVKNDIIKLVQKLFEDDSDKTELEKSFTIEVPVCYGNEYGPDLKYLSNYHKLSPDEVIRIHSSCEYRIYMLGFTPGFPYLGGMDKQIATPRKETPRTRIRAGSVGIAGSQTGIYPIDSPGGWQIIGKTPLNLLDFSAKQAFLFRAGDYLKFKAVSLTEYFDIAEAIKTGDYTIIKSASA